MIDLSPAPATVPPGHRVYAVGDVHGCAERLVALHAAIAADLARRPVAVPLLVHIGDYVDRGPDSAGVLACLLDGPDLPDGVAVVNLMGNHERTMLDALAGDRPAGTDWLFQGGRPTLESYGIDPDGPRETWAAGVPAAHRAFLQGLALHHAVGGYLFVHAGIRPGVGLAAQVAEDLLRIRQPFLYTEQDLGAVVVHGHTPVKAPVVRPNRIAIDTGAVFGGQADRGGAGGRDRGVPGGLTACPCRGVEPRAARPQIGPATATGFPVSAAETAPRIVHVGPIPIGNHLPFVLIAGPCQIESRAHALEVAAALAALSRATGVPVIYKSSFDKANRTSATAARGIGMTEGLAILAEVRAATGLPVLTDVHLPEHCAPAAEAVDVLQIPAFLCRQTDLLLAAGATGKPVNVKKGQFLAPWDMANVAAKIAATGNENILLCERGASFGYNMLVSDFRALPIMARTGYPVVFDATHSVQLPGGAGNSSGGQREFAPVLARAALAVGCAAVFIETHPDPDRAPSDGPNMIPLREMGALMARLAAFDRLAKEAPAS